MSKSQNHRVSQTVLERAAALVQASTRRNGKQTTTLNQAILVLQAVSGTASFEPPRTPLFHENHPLGYRSPICRIALQRLPTPALLAGPALGMHLSAPALNPSTLRRLRSTNRLGVQAYRSTRLLAVLRRLSPGQAAALGHPSFESPLSYGWNLSVQEAQALGMRIPDETELSSKQSSPY